MASRTLVCFMSALTALSCARSPERYNVLLVTFDTTRADHLAAYGNPRAHTPNVDRLASEGALFENAFSSIPLTLPSHSTILTGKYPPAHGVRDNGLFVLDDSQLTLAEILASHGYRTAAAVGGFPLVRRFGIGQGFDLFDDKLRDRDDDFLGRAGDGPSLFFEERSAGLVNEAVLGWLRKPSPDPFFLWVHYYDPHHPLIPPPPYDQLFADDPYLGEIAYADESFGLLLEELRRLGVYEETVIVLTADHGEGRGEHGELTHSFLLYNSTLHVPLVMRAPGVRPGERISDLVGTIDILPTLLDILGLEAPDDLQGRSLRHYVDGSGSSTSRSRPHYAETLSPRFSHDWGELRALYDKDYKYVHGPRPELYNIAVDPEETHDLIGEDAPRADAMKGRLEKLLGLIAVAEPAAAVPVDDATRKKLEALGYLSGSGGDTTVHDELRSDGVPPQDRAGDTSASSQARNLLGRGQAMPALAFINPLIKADPENSFYREMRIQALLLLGRTDEAMEEADRLENLGSGVSASLPRLKRLLALNLYKQGERAEALELFASSLTTQGNAEGYHLWASLLAEEGRHEEARAALERSIELDVGYAPALADLAVLEAQSANLAAAEALFQRALDSQPYRAKTHYNHAAFLLKEGYTEAALSSLERALRLQGDYPAAHYALVVTHLVLEQPKAAKEALARMGDILPNAAETVRARELLQEYQ